MEEHNQSDLINCQEQSDAKWMFGFSAVLMLPVLFMLFMLLRSWSLVIFVTALCFFAFSALLYVLGRYHQSKFNALGETPLLLKPSSYVVGDTNKATIFINQRDFRRVSKVRFECIRECKSQSTGHEVLYHYDYQVKPVEDGEKTRLEFEIKTSDQNPPTSDLITLSSVRIRWRLSFEYVEKMSLIRRTWEIPVLKAEPKPAFIA